MGQKTSSLGDKDDEFESLANQFVANQIVKIRKDLGVSQADFAEGINVELRTLQRYESGKSRIPDVVKTKCFALADDAGRQKREETVYMLKSGIYWSRLKKLLMDSLKQNMEDRS